MKLGILADTHNEIARTRCAVEKLREAGVEALIHCGDLNTAEIVAICAKVRFYFVLGNHDADAVPELRQAAELHSARCLNWSGELMLAGKRIAIAHGHLTSDLRPLLNSQPDYLFTGHSHLAADWREGATRRINPGALHRADEYSVAVLDLATDTLEFIRIE